MKLHQQQWLEKLDATIENELDNPGFKLEDLTFSLGTSIAQLHVKILKLTGLTPRMYIQRKRLEKAEELLEVGAYATVREVAAAVGYRHVSYFSTVYEETYGKRPREYMKS